MELIPFAQQRKQAALSILNKFERRVDRLVNGAFAKAFATEVQPVELAAALAREVDDRAVIIGAGRTVVPNVFRIELAPTDFERLNPFANALKLELSGFVREHITEQRFTTLGNIAVELNLDPNLNTGIFRVNAQAEENGAVIEDIQSVETRRGPHVILNGFVYPLTTSTTVIGRGTDADIRVDNGSISRRHCEIALTNPITIRDLGSTNGTWIQGERISQKQIVSDVDITLGDVVLQFRMR
ncbi:MAG: hypothetical protein RL038_277 [Actinomycetota bacterium]